MLRRVRQRVVRGVVLLAALVSSGLILCARAEASGDDYPAKWRDVARDTVLDDWKHFNRECVSWVSWRLHSKNGFEMPFHDNADRWGERAARLGYVVDMQPAVGAVAWWRSMHVAWVEWVSADGNFVIVEEYNYRYDGRYNRRKIAAQNVSGYIHFKDLTPSPPPDPPKSRIMFVRGDDALFAKDDLAGPWSGTTGAEWVKQGGSLPPIAVGGTNGTTQLWIGGCGSLYAKDNLGPEGWVEEAACGTAKQAAISNTGLQMMLSNCGAVYAKYGVSIGGWQTQQECGDIVAVAVGGDTQMMLSGCGAVYAKTGLHYAGWTEEAPCGTASAIAISSTGLQMMLSRCGAFYAKYGIGAGGWWAEGDCGWATAIAAGGNVHMFLSGCGAVYAKTSMGYGGWIEQAPCQTASAIAVGSRGRQVIITADSAVFAKDTLQPGGWHMQVGPGNAKFIAVA